VLNAGLRLAVRSSPLAEAFQWPTAHSERCIGGAVYEFGPCRDYEEQFGRKLGSNAHTTTQKTTKIGKKKTSPAYYTFPKND